MTSEAYIWIWLPGEYEPVVCGKLKGDNTLFTFVYGRSYLERSDAIALDPVELPLQESIFSPSFGETHNAIRDSAPDAKMINEELTELVEEKWDEAAERGALTKHESTLLQQATILSPACFY